MRRLAATGIWTLLFLSPIIAVIRLCTSNVSATDVDALLKHGVFTPALVQLVSIAIIIFAWIVTMVSLLQGIRLRRTKWYDTNNISFLSMCGVALAGFLSIGSQNSVNNAESASGIEVRTIAAPALAGIVVARALRKSLTEKDEPAVVASAFSSDANVSSTNTVELPGVAVVIDRIPVTRSWEVVVRIFGYPQVEDQYGNVAEFRKRKALELLFWLSINRDRPRRSAARTSMWESDISDSSFATIVSDMRRGLSELCPHVPPRDWAPPTFTDEIVLSQRIVTDVELLSRALDRFTSDPSHRDDDRGKELVDELSKIRDMPFAGTGYQWPDIDGSTTRFVILGAHAAREAAYWAYERKDWKSVTTAVTAGLRLVPGDEELLDLQRLVLQSSVRGLH